MYIIILKRINVKLGWFLTTRATTALMGPATESRRAVVRFGSRSLAIRKHLQQDDLRIHLHLNCRQWYLELLRYRSLPVASFPPYRWEESRALKDTESYTQIWEEYNSVPDNNNNRKRAFAKLGFSPIVFSFHQLTIFTPKTLRNGAFIQKMNQSFVGKVAALTARWTFSVPF